MRNTSITVFRELEGKRSFGKPTRAGEERKLNLVETGHEIAKTINSDRHTKGRIL